MVDLAIDTLDPSDAKLMSHLFNQVFKPTRKPEHFARRMRGRHNALFLAARVKDESVGFFVGMELKPTVFFGWLVGVTPDARRMGVATALMRAAGSWAKDHGYAAIRFECSNRMRPMLHFGIAEAYDIVGVRWEGDMAENMVILEKQLH